MTWTPEAIGFLPEDNGKVGADDFDDAALAKAIASERTRAYKPLSRPEPRWLDDLAS